jgi:hypothetical protein
MHLPNNPGISVYIGSHIISCNLAKGAQCDDVNYLRIYFYPELAGEPFLVLKTISSNV